MEGPHILLSMKLGVSITAFREKNIVPIIKQYEGIADKIMVGVSKSPWNGSYRGDLTAERAVNETGACVIQKSWRKEADQRNELMEYMRDMDYIIVSHCDTWFSFDDLKRLKSMELTGLHYDCNVYTYWKDYNTVISPALSLPTILVRSDARFTHILNIENQEAVPRKLPITCHHVSWVKTDDEILKKIQSYSHAEEIQKDWFDRVWVNWSRNMEDFAPTIPQDFKRVERYMLPNEIRYKII